MRSPPAAEPLPTAGDGGHGDDAGAKARSCSGTHERRQRAAVGTEESAVDPAVVEGGAQSRRRAGSAARRRRHRHPHSGRPEVVGASGRRRLLAQRNPRRARAQRRVGRAVRRARGSAAAWRATAYSSCPTSRGCRASAHCNRSSPSRTSATSAAICRAQRRRCAKVGRAVVKSTSTSDCRRVTMRSLGRSVLGLDLNERDDVIAEHMHVASSYTADRALRPMRAPRWLPTPARARARAGGGGVAQGHRRHAAGVPRGSDPRCAARPRIDRGDRSRNRPVDLRRRHHQRPVDLHARRSRHDGDRAHLRVVGARTSPRRAGPGRRRSSPTRRQGVDAR